MRILLVEEEEDELMWLVKKLSKAGHEVNYSSTGGGGYACWKIHRPDFVVTDYQCGGKRIRNGLELIAAIRAVCPLQAFIMQTASANILPPFGVPVLRKPYRRRQLLRLLVPTTQALLPLGY